MQVPKGVNIIAFADDVAVVAVAQNGALVEELVNPVLADISRWMTANGLTLAPAKSESIVLTAKHGYRDPVLSIDGHRIPVVNEMRYLGIQLDTRLSFIKHAAAAAAGARKTATALGRLMPNVSGPSEAKRRLLMSVVHSRLLYGAEVWADEVCKTKKAVGLLMQSQRCAALRVARCYRSVSDAAALVLARMPPAHLLALERKRVSEWRSNNHGPVPRAAMTRVTIEQWQSNWLCTSKAQWTRRVIPDVVRWWYHGPQSISHHMAQALTGHGCFQEYLYSRGRAPDPTCVHCPEEVDSVEHTIFKCVYWEHARAAITTLLGRPLLPEDLSEVMCTPSGDELPDDADRKRLILEAASNLRQAFTVMVEEIMSRKLSLERERQKEG
jgi:hypothetical protein